MLTAIHTEEAPKAIGPYSQATLALGFVFISGQLPLNPQTLKIEAVTIEEQTQQVLSNLEAILLAAGSSFDKVVKTEIFLTSMSDFKVVNTLYEKAFCGTVKPARQTIEVSALPLNAKIEISCVAVVK